MCQRYHFIGGSDMVKSRVTLSRLIKPFSGFEFLTTAVNLKM